MEILKKGIIPVNHLFYTGTCNVCGCVVKCREDDKEIIHPGISVRCPTHGCEAIIYLHYMPGKPVFKPENELNELFNDMFPPLPKKSNPIWDDFDKFRIHETR